MSTEEWLLLLVWSSAHFLEKNKQHNRDGVLGIPTISVKTISSVQLFPIILTK